MSNELDDVGPSGDEHGVAEVELARRRRTNDMTRRTLRLTPQFSAGEKAENEAAAASVGMTVNGLCAQAALTAARRLPMSYGAAQTWGCWPGCSVSCWMPAREARAQLRPVGIGASSSRPGSGPRTWSVWLCRSS
jgi:hypothetical protein